MKTNYADMGFVRTAACSPEVSIGDPEENAKRIAESSSRLFDQGISIAVFPELSMTGYTAEDLFYSDKLIDANISGLAYLAEESKLPCLVVGTPWRLRDGRLLNCAAVISENRIIGLIPKSAHPNHGEFYDLRWFSDGALINEHINDEKLGNFQIRVDQLFEVGSGVLGIELCEDLWSPISLSLIHI